MDKKQSSESYEVVHASEVDLVILGSILSRKGNNVVLLKDIESGKITAGKIGFLIFDKYYLLEIQENEMMVKVKETNKILKVVKNRFRQVKNKTAHPLQAKEKLSTSGYYSEEGFERKNNQIEISEDYKENLIKNDLPEILMQASAVPIVENGSIVGFEIAMIEDGSIYQKLGLIDGDVVTSINGVELDSVSKSIKILNSLKKSNNISIEYRRNGKIIPMNVNIK